MIVRFSNRENLSFFVKEVNGEEEVFWHDPDGTSFTHEGSVCKVADFENGYTNIYVGTVRLMKVKGREVKG